jgi:hypothetical protein
LDAEHIDSLVIVKRYLGLSECGVTEVVLPQPALQTIADSLYLVPCDLVILVEYAHYAAIARSVEFYLLHVVEGARGPCFIGDLEADAMVRVTGEHFHQILLSKCLMLGDVLEGEFLNHLFVKQATSLFHCCSH